MNYETADKAALRLGVTVRAVQKWAKEGKIPYSHKVGRDWMIPTDAIRPDDKTQRPRKHLSLAAFPLIRFYIGGDIEEYISSLETEAERSMARCEYYYFSGRLKECTIEAEPHMDSEEPSIRSMSALYCLFANLSRGFLNKSKYAAEIMKEALKNSIEGNGDKSLVAINVLASLVSKFQLHLPLDGVPRMREYVKYLDKGLSAIGCYLIAYDEYMRKNYSKSLGVAETALSLCDDNYVIPFIYLNLISAMAHINLMDTDNARKCFEKAWEVAKPHGLIMPFVEHYNLLGGLIENLLKKNDTEYYNKIIDYSKQYNKSWYEVYNKRSERYVATTLTNIEFTIAMLYSRNWRVKEIAVHINLSERTVTNYISYIYDKLQINRKKDLEKFMLR